MNNTLSTGKLTATVRQVAVLGFPLLFGQLMRYFHQIADNAMLGHYSDDSLELAAMGIAGLFTWILNTFLWPLSNGVQAITSRRFGRQLSGSDEERASTGEAFDNGLVTAAIASAIALALSFLARPVLRPLISSEEILELAVAYISVMRFALLPSGLFFVFQGFFGAINRTTYVMWSGLLSNILNIFFNYVLIYGKFGFPEMGIRGAALGTALATLISFGYLIFVMIRRGYIKSYRLFGFRHLTRGMQRDIIATALPPGVQNVAALAIFMIYQTIIEDYSAVLLAATYTAFSYYRLNKTIIGGFARSAGILAGNALGRGDQDSAHRLITSSGLIGIVIAILVAAFTLVFSDMVAGIFSDVPETREAISMALRFFTGFFFMEAIGYAFEMVFIVNGYGRYVLFSEFSTNLLFILGTTLLAKHFFPGEILYAWLSFGIYQVSHASLMIIGYFRRRWYLAEVEKASAV